MDTEFKNYFEEYQQAKEAKERTKNNLLRLLEHQKTELKEALKQFEELKEGFEQVIKDSESLEGFELPIYYTRELERIEKEAEIYEEYKEDLSNLLRLKEGLTYFSRFKFFDYDFNDINEEIKALTFELIDEIEEFEPIEEDEAVEDA